MNSTSWEQTLAATGTPIITWDHNAIRDYLVDCFKRDFAQHLEQVAADDTKRRTLQFILNYHDLGGVNFGGSVTYSKKRRRFTFIEYSDRRNYSVRISLRNPGICCPANPKFYAENKL